MKQTLELDSLKNTAQLFPILVKKIVDQRKKFVFTQTSWVNYLTKNIFLVELNTHANER